MIKVKTKDLKELGELENAYKIGYDKSLNELWFASFTLPIDDPKRHMCESFNVIEITDDTTDEFIGTFRIVPESTSLKNNEITYQCEHVLSTLLDDVLFRYHQRSNFTTDQNIQYILDQQTVENWVKGTVDFTRYFHYKFENENGLLAPLLSIPKPFDVPYEWTYDTTVYPWVLNLVEPSEKVVGELRWGKNMGSFDEHVDPTKIVNRIYPLGAGEGINQLGIESVNGGVAYIDDAESIAKYGLKKRVFVDRRFEDAQQLKDNAQSLLNQWKIPKISVKTKGADLSILDGYEFERHRLGNLIRIVVPDREDETVRIVSESKNDLTGDSSNINFELNNKTDDIATTQTDVKRKIQVNEAYSQGATNIDSHPYVDNCDQNNPAVIRFFLDEGLVNVNTMDLTFEVEEYRAYSKATKGGGATVKSTSSGGATTESTTSGGGTTESTTSGGGTSKSTNSGGGSTETSNGSGDHRHVMFERDTEKTDDTGFFERYYRVALAQDPVQYGHVAIKENFGSVGPYNILDFANSGSHSHTVTVPTHSHSFSTPDHSHSVTVPSHSHSVTIPSHTHEIDLPDHTHDVEHGIFKLSQKPTSVSIEVDGNVVPHTAITGEGIDLIPYLSVDGSGKINRGQWHEVTITPNDLGRVNAQVISRLFIQSHVGGVH